MRYLITLLALMFVGQAKAQIINRVEYPHQADVKIYFVQYAHQADAQICFVDYKHQVTKPGLWWEGDRYDSERLDVYEVKYEHQADIKVYVVEYPHQVRVNDKYIELTTQMD